SVSQATMTVTGAAFVFSTLPGARAGTRRAFAASLSRNTKRAGVQFALVGPQRASSYTSRSTSTGTRLGSHAECVRAWRNSWSRVSLAILAACAALLVSVIVLASSVLVWC